MTPVSVYVATLPTVALSGVGPSLQQFNWPPAKVQGFEIWALRMTRALVQNLAAVATHLKHLLLIRDLRKIVR